MMRKDKRLVILFLAVCAITAGVFVGILWFVDPLKIYHKPFVCKDEIYSDMRVAAYGELKWREYDSLILGTSMLENTSAKEASDKLGGKFINISLSGSDFHERSIVLDYALRNKSISKVIYSLDTYRVADRRKNKTENFDYLYDKNPFDDMKIYISYKFLAKIFNPKRKCYKSNADRPNAWFKSKWHAGRFGGLQNWAKNKTNNQIKEVIALVNEAANLVSKNEISPKDKADFTRTKEYLGETLLHFVRAYPQTEFIIVIPPYSRVFNAIDYRTLPKQYATIKESIRYLVSTSLEFKNLKIYGWGDGEYSDNIANYKDLTHYHYTFNSQMLSDIADNKALITMQNFDEYYSKFERKSAEFDLVKFQKSLEKLMQTNDAK